MTYSNAYINLPFSWQNSVNFTIATAIQLLISHIFYHLTVQQKTWKEMLIWPRVRIRKKQMKVFFYAPSFPFRLRWEFWKGVVFEMPLSLSFFRPQNIPFHFLAQEGRGEAGDPWRLKCNPVKLINYHLSKDSCILEILSLKDLAVFYNKWIHFLIINPFSWKIRLKLIDVFIVLAVILLLLLVKSLKTII